jgi:hypothetical protein
VVALLGVEDMAVVEDIRFKKELHALFFAKLGILLLTYSVLGSSCSQDVQNDPYY